MRQVFVPVGSASDPSEVTSPNLRPVATPVSRPALKLARGIKERSVPKSPRIQAVKRLPIATRTLAPDQTAAHDRRMYQMQIAQRAGGRQRRY